MSITQIKHRYNDSVLFECETPAGLSSGMALRHALENAVSASADLQSANLQSANLQYADLQYADLRSADLQSANLRSANLRSANLQYADLQYADLRYANLRSANLQSANLQYANLREGEKLIGKYPWFVVGPIGSRNDQLVCWLTDQGARLQTGCFFGTVEEFRSAVKGSHAGTKHERLYTAALVLIEVHIAEYDAN